MMTKKDFEAVASAVRSAVESGMDKGPALNWLAHDLGEHFATVNPRFDLRRFLTACGTDFEIKGA